MVFKRELSVAATQRSLPALEKADVRESGYELALVSLHVVLQCPKSRAASHLKFYHCTLQEVLSKTEVIQPGEPISFCLMIVLGSVLKYYWARTGSE